MAKKRETVDTGPLLSAFQKVGWFRNINDTVQVGIPDILGTYEGALYGIEVKSISEVPVSGIVPSKDSHRFSAKQIHELKAIEKNKGKAFGVVICGKIAGVFRPELIDEIGQVNWHKANAYIQKENGSWNLERLLRL